MIDYLNLSRVTALHGEEIRAAVASVVDSGWYLLGERVHCFERQYADYVGARHCVSCASGLDALRLMLRASKEIGRLHDGDEVIVPANTYIATILAITDQRLTPVLVEPRAADSQIDDSRIEAAITPRTRALMLVHLYGRNAMTPLIANLCQRHHLLLFEDNAQAAGGDTGHYGTAAAHSFYPGKNLGALGDAGAVTTDDRELADTVRALANYGSSEKYVFRYQGYNSRMDELQAAVLTVKLPYLKAENQRRREIADYYITHITNPAITLPPADVEHSTWHIFPVHTPQRDELQARLRQSGIQTMVHYPIPPHRQQAYHDWHDLSLPVTEQLAATELSLPIAPYLTDDEAEQVVEAVNNELKD